MAAVDPERAGVAVPHLMEALKEGALCIGPPPAFWALRKIGISAKETIPALVAGLKDSSVRLYCAYTLGLIGPDAQAAIPALVEARAHADAEFRCCAAMALVDIDPAQAKQAVIVLAKATRDPSDKVRDYVIHAVGEIGPQAKEAVPELLAALTADQKKRQSDAGLAIAQALGEIGLGAKEAVPALVAMMKADDPVNRFAPTMALGWMGSAARPAVPALKAAVEKGDPEERWFAARALVRVDRSNADAVIPLLIAGLTEVLRGHDDWLAPESLELCEALGPSAKAAAPVLLAAHKECRPAARPLLTRTLSRIDPDSAATLIPALIRNLKNADPEVRRVAIEELGIIGPPAREAVPALRALLKDPDYSLDAATALGPISGAEEETMAALMGELTRPETAQRRGTSRLNQQKTDLLSSLKDPSQSERLTMIRLLSQVFDPMPFSEGLVEIRSDSNVLLCRQVAKTLGDMGPSAKAAIPALLESRKDPDAGVRLAAACALPRVDPDQAKDVIPDLTTGLKAQEWWVRAGAARALGTIGSNAKTAAPALIECLNDPVKPVRKESANALKKIDPQRLASR